LHRLHRFFALLTVRPREWGEVAHPDRFGRLAWPTAGTEQHQEQKGDGAMGHDPLSFPTIVIIESDIRAGEARLWARNLHFLKRSIGRGLPERGESKPSSPPSR